MASFHAQERPDRPLDSIDSVMSPLSGQLGEAWFADPIVMDQTVLVKTAIAAMAAASIANDSAPKDGSALARKGQSSPSGVATPMAIAPAGQAVSMARERSSCVLVTAGHVPVGTFSTQDLLRWSLTQDPWQNLPLQTVMTPLTSPPPRLEDLDIIEVLGRMQTQNTPYLPLVDGSGSVVGLLSQITLQHRWQAMQAAQSFQQFTADLAARVIQQTRALQDSNAPHRGGTEQSAADQILQAKIMAMDRFFSVALDLLCIIDQEGHFRRLNQAWEEALGYPLEGLLGSPALDWVHPEDLAITQSALAELLQDQDLTVFINRYRCQDGTYRWLEWRATLTDGLIYAAARDVTQNKEAEQELLRKTAHLATAQRIANIGSGELDPATGQTHLSEEAFRMYGLDSAQGSPTFEQLLQLTYPEDLKVLTQQFHQSISTGHNINVQYRIQHPTKGVRYIQAYGEPIFDHLGQIQRYVGTALDITERRQAEIQLRRINTKVLEAARLKDEFLANMSHELRTPLNAVLGMAEALQEEIYGSLTPAQAKSLATIERSGRHLLDLINDILDLSKIGAGKLDLNREDVAVSSLCESSLALVQPIANTKGIRLRPPSLAGIPRFIQVDERRMQQVLVNLLGNAVKFTETGGEVSLQVTCEAGPTNPFPTITFAVIDTGIGIATEDLGKLFEPFTQIDSQFNRRQEGTGLGLALVERLVQLHGGDVLVNSTLDQGSCFAVRLPYRPSAEPIQQTGSPAPSLPVRPLERSGDDRPLVLLAEDNDANAETITEYLTAKGYRLVRVTNGRDAVAQATAQCPDVIVMDVEMPEMDGLEAIRQIRHNPELGEVPIIVLTALVMPGDEARCLAMGANVYLPKPLRLKQLTATLEAAIAKGRSKTISTRGVHG